MSDSQDLSDLQTAYDLTYDLHQQTQKNKREAGLTSAFTFAATVGAAFTIGDVLTTMAILNAGMLYTALKWREGTMTLAQKFNDSTQNLDSRAKSYLRDIERELRDVKDFSMEDLDFKKHWEEKNYIGIGFVAFSVLTLTIPLIPAALANMVIVPDTMKNQKLAIETYKAGDLINEQYGDDLTPPAGP